jgi:hypothetical protein
MAAEKETVSDRTQNSNEASDATDGTEAVV